MISFGIFKLILPVCGFEGVESAETSSLAPETHFVQNLNILFEYDLTTFVFE